MPLNSISRFIIVSIISVMVVYHAGIYWTSQDQAIHEIEELFDAQLAHSSNILFNLLGESVSTIDQSNSHLPIVYHGLEEALSDQVDEDDIKALFYQRKIAYQIYNLQGKLLIKSSSAPNEPLGPQDIGFSRKQIKDESWRVFSLYDDDWKFWLHVAESETIRDELAFNIAWQTLLPGIISLPILVILLLIIIFIGLRPLKQLANKIAERDPKNLSTIHLSRVPKEIKPVLDAINHVFNRLHDAIEREKRLTADAAHELRTPLSVVMIHAQNALQASDDRERAESLQHLEIGITRISRLLEQLLTLSKVNPETIVTQPLNLREVAENVIVEIMPKVSKYQQSIELNCDADSTVIDGSEFLLEILLRNLIDNACEYTHQGGGIWVSIATEGDAVKLIVDDNGPGVPEENRPKLSERFYRQGQTNKQGAGLGLSLVQAIVEFHHGTLVFNGSKAGGLSAQVTLPRSPKPYE